MNTHVGLIKSLNNIDYNYHSIPDIVTIYPNFLLSDEDSKLVEILNSNNKQTIQSILNCLKIEIQDIILQSKNQTVNLKFPKLFHVNKIKGIVPAKEKNNYAILNLGQKGYIQFKHDSGEKYSFMIDKNMLLWCNDIDSNYVRYVPIQTSEDTEDRIVLIFENEIL